MNDFPSIFKHCGSNENPNCYVIQFFPPCAQLKRIVYILCTPKGRIVLSKDHILSSISTKIHWNYENMKTPKSLPSEIFRQNDIKNSRQVFWFCSPKILNLYPSCFAIPEGSGKYNFLEHWWSPMCFLAVRDKFYPTKSNEYPYFMLNFLRKENHNFPKPKMLPLKGILSFTVVVELGCSRLDFLNWQIMGK